MSQNADYVCWPPEPRRPEERWVKTRYDDATAAVIRAVDDLDNAWDALMSTDDDDGLMDLVTEAIGNLRQARGWWLPKFELGAQIDRSGADDA